MSVFQRQFREGGEKNGALLRTKRYVVQFRDHQGRRRRLSGFNDRSAAERLERRLEELVHVRATGGTPDAVLRAWIESLAPRIRDRLAKFGLLTTQQVAGLRPLSKLQEAWEEHLRAAGRAEKHIRNTTAAVKRVFKETGATYWSEIDSGRVEAFLATARTTTTPATERTKEKRPIGARASNFRLSAARQFCRWCVLQGHAAEDPLRTLRPLNVAKDRRRERRALTAEEVQRLVAAAEAGPEIDGMSGPVRAILYRAAAETGLRRGELLALVVADLDVEDKHRASVRARAATTKNGRETRLPLKAKTAEALAKLTDLRTPLARVFPVSKHWRAFDAIQADLAAAEIPYVDEAGLVADFHALRTTFGTSLARARVPLALAQRLMRHSTPVLTSNVYTVLTRDDERSAIESLPDAAAAPPVAPALAATGTDGRANLAVPLTPGLTPEGGKHARSQGDRIRGIGHARRDSNPQPADPKTTAVEPAAAPLAPGLTPPADPRLAALLAAWPRLDNSARETVLRVAVGLSGAQAGPEVGAR